MSISVSQHNPSEVNVRILDSGAVAVRLVSAEDSYESVTIFFKNANRLQETIASVLVQLSEKEEVNE